MKKISHFFFLLFVVSLLSLFFTLYYSYKNNILLQFGLNDKKIEKKDFPPFQDADHSKIENKEIEQQEETTDEIKQRDFSAIKEHRFERKNSEQSISILLMSSVFIFVLSTRYLLKSSFGRKKAFLRKRALLKSLIVTLIITFILVFSFVKGMNLMRNNNHNKPDINPPNIEKKIQDETTK